MVVIEGVVLIPGVVRGRGAVVEPVVEPVVPEVPIVPLVPVPVSEVVPVVPIEPEVPVFFACFFTHASQRFWLVNFGLE